MKLGQGFADTLEFSRTKPKNKKTDWDEDEGFNNHARIAIFSLILLIFPLVLIGRLFYLQIIVGAQNRQISEENRVRIKPLPAPRGIIFDRNDQILVRNIPGYRLKTQESYRVLSRDKALDVEAHGGMEAANLEIDILREYLYPEIFAHVLGYTSEITQEELKTYAKTDDYQGGDKVGRAGIEKEYEKTLRGQKGKEFIEVDAQEKKLGILNEELSQPGQNLTLSFDLNLQKSAYEALGNVRGVVVVSRPSDGQILALVSRPSFDPNLFTVDQDEEKIKQLFNDDREKPFLNRAISGVYPPGSTFKIVTAAAGLEEGKIDKSTLIEDTGEIVIGPYRFPNWYLIQYGKTEGNLDVVGALKRSNDIFFYKTAGMVGEGELGKWAAKFGVGQKLGIPLEGESSGLMPNPQWKEKNIGEKWYLGDTYHIGIGQGYVLTTPLQVNFWTAVIANGGILYKPLLVKSDQAVVIRKDFLKTETIDLIKKGMIEACSTGGTGWPLFDFKVGDRAIQTACKTGTAEYGDPKGRTHAWFTVFAPAENPQIVATVLVEGGGEGSNVGAPIAKKVLEEYFRDKQ
ncbi:penicillin-binding protein 2 [Candidatus Microgenomates bacterium]|nr:penicillin-binding protein 2 [Candidatus Microgenomates bacterium]